MSADLTIVMPSWNKEKYIAEALDSIFAQQTTYTYQIVVADDHSTDRTLEIVEDCARQHPGVFKVLRADVNQKLFRNVCRAYEICKTPYFCVLDPDDYWLDGHHIQKALDYLESHRDFTIYSAGIEMLKSDGSHEPCQFPSVAVDSDFEDFLKQRACIAFTQTCVYRNVVFSNGLPALLKSPTHESMERTYRGDSFRNFLHVREGRAHFCPEIEGCYRETDEGVFQGIGELGRLVLNAQLYVDLWRYDDGRHTSLLAFSKHVFNQAKSRLFDRLGEKWPKDEKVLDVVRSMCQLQAIYKSNEKEIDACNVAALNFKDRIRCALCRKLIKKGVLAWA